MGSPTFDTSRARFGDLIAGVAGLVLFISLFLHWYSGTVKATVGGFSGTSISETASAWKALGFIDILLAVIALVAIAIAVARIAGVLPRLAFTPGQVLLALGGLATILVLFRIISIPHGDVPNLPGVDVSFGREFGIFLALIAAIGVTVGGWLDWNEEGRPMPGSAGGAGAPGGGGPLGAGQPYGGQPGGGYGEQPVRPTVNPQTASEPTAGGGAVGGGAVGGPAVGGEAVGGGAVGGAGAGQATSIGGAAAGAGAGDPAPPPGGKADWYADPRGVKRLRYFDGTRWTDHTAD